MTLSVKALTLTLLMCVGTLLYMAINFGFTDMVNLLIEKGAEINTVNSNGCNPFISYMERIKEDSTEPEAIDALDKKKVEIALNLMTGIKNFLISRDIKMMGLRSQIVILYKNIK